MCDSCALLFPPPLSSVCDFERIGENLGWLLRMFAPRGLGILEWCFGFRVEENFRKVKMRGTWRMLSALAMLSLLSFFMVIPVDAQNTSTTQTPDSSDVCKQCDAHATCYETTNRVKFCDCHSFYSGNGSTCKFETWRLVAYVIFTVLAFICVFYLCLSCLGYNRRYQESTAYPMQPMGNAPYAYRPGPNQSTAHPAMYGYPPFNGYPPQPDYPQTGYPVSAYPPPPAPPAPPVEPSSKVPGPSGSEGMDKAPGSSTSHAGPAQ